MVFLRLSPFTIYALVSLLALSSSSILTHGAQNEPVVFPPSDKVPPVDSPQVRQWLSEINLSGAPNIALNTAQPGNPPECPTQPTRAADDVVECPVKNEWAPTFDNGPTEATPQLLDFLKEMDVKATFFVVGGNAAKYPETIMRQDDDGHQLASHSWSHAAFTTLTNEEIVAEIRWTEKAIFDATSRKVKYFRPPYGDMDNRVRYVLRQLGYTVVQWTPGPFDFLHTKDPGSVKSQISKFKSAMKSHSKDHSRTGGLITVESDETKDQVKVAKAGLKEGRERGLHLMTIAACLGDERVYA
ncbi:chitin deacetylase [Podila minutissima]|uniref:Chitin deacetylase n=1 Tax=Podila minutissima TaxID=64525 RepID=A0A9P5VJT4_9FUNG|nr:chitin deacetylase [Podila minutissima]